MSRALVAILIALSLFLLGCPPSVQAITADAVAAVANASIDPLLAAYETEGNEAIQNAGTIEELMMAIPTVQERWEPLWASLRAFAEAHDVWATALEQGQEGDLAAVQAAWCALRAVAVEFGVRIGDFPVLLCGP